MNKPIRHYPVVCSNCGAECAESKHLARFERRHPALCTARKEFNRQLARGTRSVEQTNEIEEDEPIHAEAGPSRRWR